MFEAERVKRLLGNTEPGQDRNAYYDRVFADLRNAGTPPKSRSFKSTVEMAVPNGDRDPDDNWN